MNNVELEKKVVELNNRLVKLEKIEKRRKIRLYIKIGLLIVIIIVLIILGIKLYGYVNENIIEPINTVKDNDLITNVNKLLGK